MDFQLLDLIKIVKFFKQDMYICPRTNIHICSQNPTGTSSWAGWVRDGIFPRDSIYWAFKLIEEGSIEWLLIHLDNGKEKEKLFDLTTEEGKLGLAELESQIRQIIEKRKI